MITYVMEWLSFADYVLPEDIKVLLSFIVCLYILNFLIDIIRFLIYYISGRK